MVRTVCRMQLPATLTHKSSKTKSPDPVLGIGRLPKKHAFSVCHRSFPSTGAPRKTHRKREARAFPPKPSVPIISRGIAPVAVGYLSCRLKGSELRFLVYACAKRMAI